MGCCFAIVQGRFAGMVDIPGVLVWVLAVMSHKCKRFTSKAAVLVKVG